MISAVPSPRVRLRMRKLASIWFCSGLNRKLRLDVYKIQLVSEPPVLVAMNKPSLVKFMPKMPAGGTLLYNASLIEDVELRQDISAIAVPCNEIAERLQNSRVSNMVMLGAIQAATDVVTDENLIETLRDWLGEKKAAMLDINRQAIEEGRAAARKRA